MSKYPTANTPPGRREEGGFTLLEVMVALAVFATLAGAVMTAGHYALKQNARLEEKLFGAWIADNHLSELQLGAVPATPSVELSRSFNQRDWRLSQGVSRAVALRLLNVELSVSPDGSDRVIHRTRGWIDSFDR